MRAQNPELESQTSWVVRLPAALPYGLFMGPSALEPGAWALLLVGGTVAVWRRVAGGASASNAAWGAILPWWIVGLVISIGPAFFWFDTVVENIPVAWIHHVVPAAGALRAPDRLRVATLMASALGAGLAFAECDRGARALARRCQWPERALSMALTALVLACLFASVPKLLAYPVKSIERPKAEMIEVLRRRGGSVVEAPAPPTDTLIHTRAMTRAIVHQRPLLNGYSGYWPADFPARMALVGRLPDRDALRRLRSETGLESIVVHRRRLSPEATERWNREIADAQSPFRLAWQDSALMVVDLVESEPAGGAGAAR